MSELIATVEQDFDFDLEDPRRPDFPFRKFIITNSTYRDLLFNQFKELPAEPKEYWYYEGRKNEGYLTEDEKYRWDNHFFTKDIHYKDVEAKLDNLTLEFLKNRKTLDGKYNGRNLLHAPLVKILLLIGEQINDFEKHVSSGKTVSSEKYIEAFASEFIATTNKLNIPNLKNEIITFFINRHENEDLFYEDIANLIPDATNKFLYRKTDALKAEYKELKIYANKLLREEVLKGGNSNETKLEYDTNTHPLIPIKTVSDFYRFCIIKELFATEISEIDFIVCFNKNKQPTKHPIFKVKNQLVYFLSKFDTINSKVAKSNFGIKDYTNDKSEIKKRAKPKPEITKEIDKIVKQD